MGLHFHVDEGLVMGEGEKSEPEKLVGVALPKQASKGATKPVEVEQE